MVDTVALMMFLVTGILSGALAGMSFAYALDTGQWFWLAIAIAMAVGAGKRVVNEATE